MAEIYFTKEHEWVRLQDGVGVVGISEHAAQELGDVTFVELPKIGVKVGQFDLLGSIESVKAASDIFAPVSGTVVKVNGELEGAPELVNESPWDRGWMAWLELDDATELEKLMTEEQYACYLKSL
ncbi:glycine cleavage system protein GcvH [Pelobacter propionicus]|uniref:Glycine cleavage system H protein n=1 Tax=Pelobacter propionicus (strain DSM 2379 / NBRC 103807 / OttBd1) TaxID=338966 RepID=A1APD6_PELPD|nr:glycine cleavage system protein GcvH [Pelobacter propionicus]ABK99206.1 glycine cleavage system H protein [Pelobacter propionicus DSM 2379]